MIRNELLLQGNPTYVLAPHIDLTQNIVTKPDKENSEGPFNCDGCGKALDSEYYISFGIPPSPLIVETYLCKSLSCEKNIDSQIVSWIRSRATIQNIDSEYQWIFSEQNIRVQRHDYAPTVKENTNGNGGDGKYPIFINNGSAEQLKNINDVIHPLALPDPITKDIFSLCRIEVI